MSMIPLEERMAVWMAQVMMVSDGLADYIIEQLSAWGEVSVRRTFGRAGPYHDGTMLYVLADHVRHRCISALHPRFLYY